MPKRFKRTAKGGRFDRPDTGGQQAVRAFAEQQQLITSSLEKAQLRTDQYTREQIQGMKQAANLSKGNRADLKKLEDDIYVNKRRNVEIRRDREVENLKAKAKEQETYSKWIGEIAPKAAKAVGEMAVGTLKLAAKQTALNQWKADMESGAVTDRLDEAKLKQYNISRGQALKEIHVATQNKDWSTVSKYINMLNHNPFENSVLATKYIVKDVDNDMSRFRADSAKYQFGGPELFSADNVLETYRNRAWEKIQRFGITKKEHQIEIYDAYTAKANVFLAGQQDHEFKTNTIKSVSDSLELFHTTKDAKHITTAVAALRALDAKDLAQVTSNRGALEYVIDQSANSDSWQTEGEFAQFWTTTLELPDANNNFNPTKTLSERFGKTEPLTKILEQAWDKRIKAKNQADQIARTRAGNEAYDLVQQRLLAGGFNLAEYKKVPESDIPDQSTPEKGDLIKPIRLGTVEGRQELLNIKKEAEAKSWTKVSTLASTLLYTNPDGYAPNYGEQMLSDAEASGNMTHLSFLLNSNILSPTARDKIVNQYEDLVLAKKHGFFGTATGRDNFASEMYNTIKNDAKLFGINTTKDNTLQKGANEIGNKARYHFLVTFKNEKNDSERARKARELARKDYDEKDGLFKRLEVSDPNNQTGNFMFPLLADNPDRYLDREGIFNKEQTEKQFEQQPENPTWWLGDTNLIKSVDYAGITKAIYTADHNNLVIPESIQVIASKMYNLNGMIKVDGQTVNSREHFGHPYKVINFLLKRGQKEEVEQPDLNRTTPKQLGGFTMQIPTDLNETVEKDAWYLGIEENTANDTQAKIRSKNNWYAFLRVINDNPELAKSIPPGLRYMIPGGSVL